MCLQLGSRYMTQLSKSCEGGLHSSFFFLNELENVLNATNENPLLCLQNTNLSYLKDQTMNRRNTKLP